MLINDYLRDNSMTKYRLSKMAGLPYGPLNDIIKGKTDLAKCTGETLQKIDIIPVSFVIKQTAREFFF